MQKFNVKNIPPDPSMSKYFEGRVEIKKMITDTLTKDFETFLVTFHDGARTKLHYHEVDQALVATEGSGIVVIETDVRMDSDSTATIRMNESHTMSEGEFVCIPALRWHWHGAAKDSKFSHLQIKKPGKTVWAE